MNEGGRVKEERKEGRRVVEGEGKKEGGRVKEGGGRRGGREEGRNPNLLHRQLPFFCPPARIHLFH